MQPQNSLITIDEPAEGEAVPYSVTVRGRAIDCHGDVQVLILSADDLWYQQKRAHREGIRWWTDVKVGYRDPNADSYRVAILGNGPRIPHPDPIDSAELLGLELEGYVVQTVSVRRR